MEKRIPIDQLFHEKLSNGTEQLNLGAWANMERLLDGKNPYPIVEEEPQKKRRIFPFILLFTLLSSILTATLLNSKFNKKEAISEANEHKLTSANTSSNNSVSENQSEKNISNISNENPNEPTTHVAVTNTQNKNEQENDNNKNLNVTINNSTNSTNYSSESNTTNTKKRNKKLQKGKLLANTSNTENQVNTTENSSSNSEKEKSSSLSNKNNLGNEEAKKISKTVRSIQKDTVAVYEIKEKFAHRKNASAQKEYDTIGKHQKIVEKMVETTVFETPENEAILSSKKEPVVNPRFVQLSSEEELNANKKTSLQSNSESTSIASTSSNSSITNTKSAENTSTSIKKSSTHSHNNFIFQKLQNASNKLSMKKIEMYPGMSVGVNAAFFNTEHNYGGFHFGLNNLIPVSNYFSILSELKLFYKNNSGFTPKDIQSSMFDYTKDVNTLSSSNQTIHKYQVDSTTKIYNFKSFTTIELPILLQVNIKKLSPYIGANLAYGFKLNTNEVTKKYSPLYADTLSSSAVFNNPISNSFQYVKEDFGSRFGIGYTIGTSYSFNPNLYIDLRLSNTVWDNSKTLSSRQISNGVFKVPFMQFSIGYRFKKYTPNN